MKQLFFIALILSAGLCKAQYRNQDFSSIDWKVREIDDRRPDSLSIKLTAFYNSDLEKCRAIFSWITQHISYNTQIYSYFRWTKSRTFITDDTDTNMVWKSGIEMTAIKVLKNRFAVCDGYAKLFKTLCDYAGLRSEIITGYARGYQERNFKFRSNHTWNAVMIDSSWYLMDLTWASGFINASNEFVQRTDEKYFMTPPGEFILDHWPEDQRWVLMDDPPVFREFRKGPFRYKSFVKYGITDIHPSSGMIEAAVGDTLLFEVNVKDPAKNKKISPDPFFDSTVLSWSAASVYLNPQESGEKVQYQFIVNDSSAEWLNLMYNGDLVLRYKLNVRRETRTVNH